MTKKLIVGRNHVDIHTADSDFESVATCFNRRWAHTIVRAVNSREILMTALQQIRDRCVDETDREIADKALTAANGAL